jgi:transcriptional regulator with XRE-family HTH domain
MHKQCAFCIFYDQPPSTMQAHEKIQILRTLRRIPQDYMAHRLGITQSCYSRIESGQTQLKEKMKQDILNILEMTSEDFEKWDGKATFNFHDQKGGHAGQFNHTNDPEAIAKIMEANARIYEQQIDYLKQTVAEKDKKIERLWGLFNVKA